jgi:hypothetical protein
MSLSTSGNADVAQRDNVQLTLGLAEAQDLVVVLPWLLHALADRPAQPKLKERRRIAREALERLLSALSSQLDTSE